MKKVLILTLVFVAASGFVFAAGGGEDESGSVIEVASSSTAEGNIAVQRQIFGQLIDEYNAANGTAYEVKFVGNQGMDIINTRMSSNDKPDVFLLDSPADVHQYASDGLLLDLSAYAEADGWKDVLFNWAYDLSKSDGKVVTLPYGYEGMVLWYNKNIMKELNLVPEEIDTLAEYEDALRKAQDAGYIPCMLGSQDWPWAQEWYLSILYSYTGRDLVKAAVEGKASWTDPAFRKTVELYKSWHDKGYLADGKSYVLTSDDAINAFSNDKALFKLEGTWAPYWIVPLDQADQDKIGVMLHPAINDVEKPHMPLAVGGMWVVSADTENPDVSAYLLSGLLRQESQDDYLQQGMDIAPMAIEASRFEGLAPVVENMWSIVNGALANGSFGYTTWAFYPPETRVYLYEGIVNVLEENISIDEYLKEMQRLNEKELAGGFLPVLPSAH